MQRQDGGWWPEDGPQQDTATTYQRTSPEPVTGTGESWAGPAPAGQSGTPSRRIPVIVATLTAMFAGLGLLTGLVLWSPWEPRPVTPAAVNLSATSGSVTVVWSPEPDSPTADQYVILRDGSEVAEVRGSYTSYTDEGLVPGTAYTYQVVAVVGTRRSKPTATKATSVPAPPPAWVRVDMPTMRTFVLNWSPPPDSPQPDSYVIFRGGKPVATVPGVTTTYRDPELALGSSYRFRVAARWAGNNSEPSAAVKVKLYAAPLYGSTRVTIKGTNGHLELATWTFTPKCKGDGCPIRLWGFVGGRFFSTTLRKESSWGFGQAGFLGGRSLGTTLTPIPSVLEFGPSFYTGTTKATIVKCGGLWTGVKDTLHLRIDRGDIGRRTWKGKLKIHSPYKRVGNRYCSANSRTFTVRGTLG